MTSTAEHRGPSSALLSLFHIGLALSLTHLAVALQLGVTLSRQGILMRTLVLFLYPVAFACVGLGAAAGQSWFPRLRANAPLRASGLALLVFFVVALRLHFMTGDTADLAVASIAHLGALGAWFVCVGLALGPLLRQAHRAGASWVGRGWAVHLLGLVAGYLGFDLLVGPTGANVILVATGLSLALLPRLGIVVLAIVLWSAPTLDLDWRLERFRKTEENPTKRYDFLAPKLGSRGKAISSRFQPLFDRLDEPIFHGWSRLSQLRFVEATEVGAGIAAFYNYHFMWLTGPASLRGPKDDLREEIYALIPPDGEVLVIGAGGGRGLYSFPISATQRDHGGRDRSHGRETAARSPSRVERRALPAGECGRRRRPYGGRDAPRRSRRDPHRIGPMGRNARVLRRGPRSVRRGPAPQRLRRQR